MVAEHSKEAKALLFQFELHGLDGFKKPEQPHNETVIEYEDYIKEGDYVLYKDGGKDLADIWVHKSLLDANKKFGMVLNYDQTRHICLYRC